MYHGIIQDSQWTLPGSYLRQRIQQYQLDKVINLGRIWRLRYDGVPAVPATPAQPNSGADAGQSGDSGHRAELRAAADVRGDAGATGARISVIRTAGGATRRSGC